ncbi:unnamed protein product [Rhizophagus irregularis]|uniref:HAT C-terminal dimerisation domain-containing protein n=1 Tax=Rhizophagus irregularis TaxID=588596 RepID=A0A915Z722_9GLOM|nr:unnamed protein product [Rhizophagus irregularis]
MNYLTCNTETPYTWWFSIEDSFPKDEDYLVQLALKLFSITPHAAGCERVLSSLNLLELEDDLLDCYNNEEEIIIDKEEELDIDNILNLDAFVDTLDDIIEDIIDRDSK